jgi:molybdate transport system ATP-binding protein
MNGVATQAMLHMQLQLQRGDFVLDVNDSLPHTSIIAVFGPSGAGKTSLLRCLAGLEPAAAGVLALNHTTWQDQARRLFVPHHQRGIGMVFQEARLFDHLTTRENLEYGLRRTPAAQRRLSLEEVVTALQLEPLLKRTPQQLSGGEAQRIALGRALLACPQLLLLDEPLSALDRALKDAILPFLAQLPGRLGMPIIYVSHTLDEVIRLADHLLLLEDGRISSHGPLADMFQRLDLSLAQRDDAGAVLEAEVQVHDDHYHLTTLGFADQQLTVSRLAYTIGTRLRLHIQARDVSLTLQPPADTTILNILPCTIAALASARSPAQSLIKLETAGQVLLARVTRKSCEQLDLRPGMKVYAQIKSVALVA